MEKGIILLLNGTSSSGKTTLAQELQEILEEPLHIPQEAALLVKRFLDQEEQPTAFDQLRSH